MVAWADGGGKSEQVQVENAAATTLRQIGVRYRQDRHEIGTAATNSSGRLVVAVKLVPETPKPPLTSLRVALARRKAAGHQWSASCLHFLHHVSLSPIVSPRPPRHGSHIIKRYPSGYQRRLTHCFHRHDHLHELRVHASSSLPFCLALLAVTFSHASCVAGDLDGALGSRCHHPSTRLGLAARLLAVIGSACPSLDLIWQVLTIDRALEGKGASLPRSTHSSSLFFGPHIKGIDW